MKDFDMWDETCVSRCQTTGEPSFDNGGEMAHACILFNVCLLKDMFQWLKVFFADAQASNRTEASKWHLHVGRSEHTYTHTHTHTHKHTHTQRDRQTDRQTYRQRDRQTDYCGVLNSCEEDVSPPERTKWNPTNVHESVRHNCMVRFLCFPNQTLAVSASTANSILLLSLRQLL